MEYNSFKTTQTATGIIYVFGSGHVIETDANMATATVEFPPVPGCGPIRGIIRNSGDAFDAIRRNKPIPAHCKTW